MGHILSDATPGRISSMKRDLCLAPSILSADFAKLGEEIVALEAGGAGMIHVDVMDGHFVPNITVGPPVVRAIRPFVSTWMDVHLMIAPADPYLQDFSEAGADIITVHAEVSPHLDRTLTRIRDLGCKAGVALTPSSPPDALAYVLDRLDLILIMTVNPGFGGQKFLHSQIAKIQRVRTMINQRPIIIQVDGGITEETAPLCVRAGADTLVAGSSILGGGAGHYSANMQKLRQSCESALHSMDARLGAVPEGPLGSSA